MGDMISGGIGIIAWAFGWGDVATTMDPKDATYLLRRSGIRINRLAQDNQNGMWILSVSNPKRARQILAQAKTPQRPWWSI